MAEIALQKRGRAAPPTIRRLPAIECLTLLVALVLPMVVQDYLTIFSTRVLILALFALSFDLVWGYCGILSFGQALFFGAAGYGAAVLARDYGLTSVFAVLPSGILIGASASLLLGGMLLLGRNPSSIIFVALGTLTGSYAVDRLIRGWSYLGGQNGIPSFPAMTFGSYELFEGPVFYYMVLAILSAVYLACRFIVRSQFGLALAALRENERRVSFFGYRTQHIKLIMFTLGGAVAGLAGSLYAVHEGFVWPSIVGVVLSTQVALYVLCGGSGTLIGAVLGTVMVEGLSFWLSDNYQAVWPIMLGVLLLLVCLFRPLGLISLLVSERERIGSFASPTKE